MKNIAYFERCMRISAAGLLLALVWFWDMNPFLIIAVGVSSALLITGLAGWCPAHALIDFIHKNRSVRNYLGK